MIVSNVMTGHPITIGGEKTVAEAADALREHRIHCLPVVDATGRPIGAVSTRNLLRAAVPRYATRELMPAMQHGPDIPSIYAALREIAGHRVDEVMERTLCIVRADTPTSAVAATLINLQTDCPNALVVDDEGVLVGTVTALDIVERFDR